MPEQVVLGQPDVHMDAVGPTVAAHDPGGAQLRRLTLDPARDYQPLG